MITNQTAITVSGSIVEDYLGVYNVHASVRSCVCVSWGDQSKQDTVCDLINECRSLANWLGFELSINDHILARQIQQFLSNVNSLVSVINRKHLGEKNNSMMPQTHTNKEA